MLSVLKAPEVKPLICFGHDECIYKQLVLISKAWKCTNGEIAPVPKDDGAGIMISTFQSHEFGFGMHLCDEQLKEVNKYHEGKYYTDKDAAMAMRKQRKKQCSPVVHSSKNLSMAKINQGYWTYQWMVCQFDGCMDILKVLSEDKNDFIFLFDHSCGHSKKKSDGLIKET